jgi:hypothetical protein
MLIQNCILDGNIFFTAPLVRTEPEQEWLDALNSGAIPGPLFELYRRADFLSFGSAPSFLRDDKKILFSYFSMLVRSIMEALADAETQLKSFIETNKLVYDAGKKLRGESWDPTADARARKHFRDLLVACHSSMDSLADLTALFFTGRISRLTLGRSQFTRIEDWLKRPLPKFGLVLTPYDQPILEFYNALNPLVLSPSPESNWLPFMRLLRNKAEHLGQPVFRQIGLHDATPQFYTFIPRQWPYIWEEHMTRHGEGGPVDPNFISKHFTETLVHQDIVTYAQGHRAKVRKVIHAGIEVLLKTYVLVENFGLNQAALAELQGNSESYNFEYFLDS